MTTGIPLDKKDIREGSTEAFPALHPHWVSKSRFVAYLPPPDNDSDQGQTGEWLERLQYLATDLHWLLQLSHHRFWCQVIFDESLHQVLESFLRFAPRSHDAFFELPGDTDNLHDRVTHLVFLAYLRMATYKESKENWMTPEVFGEIIYENFLFDIPKMLDLCAIYGHSNLALLSKMVGSVFSHQPHYLKDLKDAVPTVLQVLSNICIKCGLESEASVQTPQKLSDGSVGTDINVLSATEFQDVLFYLADTVVTLTAFFTVYPSACAVFQQFQFCQHLAHTFEKVIPAFESYLKQQIFENIRHKKMLRNKLQQARTHLLMAFHLVIDNTCLQPVLSDPSNTDIVNKFVEDFLTIMSSVLGEKRFLADYEGLYSFQDDMDIFCQSCDVDEAHYKYIQDAINSAFAAHGKRKKPKGNTNTGGRTSPDGSPCPPSVQHGMAHGTAPLASRSPPVSARIQTQGAAAEDSVSEVEMDSLVCAVKHLLPHLGDGFIERALEEFGFSAEQVVNAVLEEKLPDSLQHLDFSQERRRKSTEVKSSESLILDTRQNIYDKDEFDVFHRSSCDMNRIHKGKRDKEVSLDDKRSVRELKILYDAYGSMDVPSMYDKQMYDDEYDDTYDANTVGADDADSADELTQRRPFTMPQVLRQPLPKSDRSDYSSEEEEEEQQDIFLKDPAQVRAQQEERRAAQRKHAGMVYDVKGRGRGQGQSETVLRNRQRKEKNKGKHANHNRRTLADKKMSKGMV